MRTAFESYITQHQLINPDDRVLVAFSGGPDSVTLATLLLDTGHQIAIAHMNFGLRGSASDADEAFSADFAKKHKLVFHHQSVDAKQYAETQKISLQMAARQLRLQWFQSLCNQYDYDAIGLGHHADDQVETFFINLFRGAGLKGLKAMEPKSGKLIRPLLFADRAQIMQYVKSNKLAYRTDSSNLENIYLRNSIRNKLLPIIESIDVRAISGLKQSILHLKQNHDLYHELLDKQRTSLLKKEGDKMLISKKKLREFSAQQSLLFELLQPFQFDKSLIPRMIAALDGPSGKVFHSRDYVLYVERNFLELVPATANENEKPVYIYEPTIFESEQFTLSFRLLKKDAEFSPAPASHLAFLDADKLQFPLCVRPWKDGDRFSPLGMQNSKLLSDFFTDNKLSHNQKKALRLLCNKNGDIVWIIGMRIDHRYRITGSSRNIMLISFSRPANRQQA